MGWFQAFLKVEMDPDMRNNYYEFGATQLISVPYALEGRHAESLTLTNGNGTGYVIRVDSRVNLFTEEIITGWPCGNPLFGVLSQEQLTLSVFCIK